MGDQFRQVLNQLSLAQRAMIFGTVVVSVVIMFVFVSVASQPQMEAAFTRLTPTTAGAVSDALRSAKIPFTLADAGATILVPSSQLSAARVAASGVAGTAADSKGFDLFDSGGFGMSDFDQQVTYQRAIQGELTQTIQAMEGVDTARVAIVPAHKGLFADQDQPASASVMILMRNGQPPSSAMVRGITSTVASAVSGLTAENVTVVDNTGRVLSGPSDAVAGDAMSAQLQIERDTQEKVELLLDQTLGTGKAAVSVSATMDFDKVEQQVTTYTPVTTDAWTPLSVQRTTETYSGTNGTSSSGGIPGSVSNVPGLISYPNVPSAAPSASPAPSGSPSPSASPKASAAASAAPSAAASAAGSPGYQKVDETVNYNLSQSVEHIVRQPGSVKRMSIAVLVDQSAATTITPEALKQAITAAIGADPTRGDLVSVTAVPFATASAAPTAAATDGGIMGQAAGIIPTVFGLLLGSVLVFLFWRNTRALRRRGDEMALLGAGDAVAALGSGEALANALPEAPEFAAGSPHAQVQQQLRLVADQKPDALVGLMNQWLLDNGKRR